MGLISPCKLLRGIHQNCQIHLPSLPGVAKTIWMVIYVQDPLMGNIPDAHVLGWSSGAFKDVDHYPIVVVSM